MMLPTPLASQLAANDTWILLWGPLLSSSRFRETLSVALAPEVAQHSPGSQVILHSQPQDLAGEGLKAPSDSTPLEAVSAGVCRGDPGQGLRGAPKSA